MATYYVDPAGDDGDPGTEAQPWQTVAHAATTVGAGDTVYYKDGTYDIGTQVAAWTSGTSGNTITHAALNRRQAIWEQTAYGATPISLTAESYIEFNGLIFQQEVITSLGTHIYLDGCDNIIFDDCEVRNTSPHCVRIDDGCSNITLLNCDLHADTDTVGVGRNGVLIYGPGANTDILIDGCTIYDCPHTGISSNSNCSSSDSYIIRNCTIYSNDSHGISISKAHNVEIYDNIVYDAGGQGPRNSAKTGIRIVEDASADVYRNVIRDCTGAGVMIESDVDDVNVWNNTIENCTDVGNDYGSIGILYRAVYDQGSIEIKNNIIYHTQASRRCLLIDNNALAAVTTMDYNLWYDSTAEETMWIEGTTYGTFADYVAAGYEPNSVMSSDPTFVNRAAHNFRLLVGSPAINAGVDVGLPYRGTDPDMGAFEFAEGTTVHVTIIVTVVTAVQT